MPSKLFREVYGYDALTRVPARWERQIETKTGVEIDASECPFTRYGCWKKSQDASIGVCGGSESKNGEAVITCPKRFHVDSVWSDLRSYFFEDSEDEFTILSEADVGEPGNVDLLAVTHRDDKVTDYVPVEIQSSYFSGGEVKSDFERYMEGVNAGREPEMPDDDDREMDYRSCVDKRLIPQLLTKAATVKTWDKPFAIVLQDMAFDNSNVINQTEEVKREDADLFWFIYEYNEDSPQYRVEREREVYHTTLESVIDAFDGIPAKSVDEFRDYSERKLSEHIDPTELFLFLYNRAEERENLEWYPKTVRFTDFDGVGDRTAKKLSGEADLIEDLLTVSDEVRESDDEIESDDYELAEFVKDAVSSQYHDDVLEEVAELAAEARNQREESEAEQVRHMDDWTLVR